MLAYLENICFINQLIDWYLVVGAFTARLQFPVLKLAAKATSVFTCLFAFAFKTMAVKNISNDYPS